MKKIKLNDLKKLGKELNELLFDEDDKKNGWVDIKAPEKDLTAAITEILMKEEDGELFVTEDDFEELSEKSVEIIKSIRAAAEAKLLKDSEKADSKDKKDKKKKSKADPEPGPEPEEENENADLIKQVEECEELIDLKKLVKSEEILAPLRKGIGIQKNLDKLRIRVLAHLNGEETPKKDTVKKVDGKGASYFVRYFTCQNPKITVNQIESKLKEKGLSQSPSSISIRRTEMIRAIEIMNELKKLK